MITLQCDNCDRAFEVTDDEAGEKVPCPHCGDINRVPANAVAAASAGQTPQAERELRKVRPAMFRAHPLRYTLIVLGFLGGAVLSIAAPVSESVPAWLVWPGLIIIAITGAFFLYWWIMTHWWMKLVVTNKRSIRTAGIIQRHTTEVLHDHVRSVDINQTFIQRIFKVGRLGIDSAGQDEIEIIINDIPDPYEVKQLIDKYRKM